MERKVKVGVIGLGTMGEQYIRAFRNHTLAEVTAVASRAATRARDIAERYSIATACEDWHELIGRPDVDAVYVATPDHLHYEPARAALEAGKHVLIEKPITLDVAEADSLIETARRTRLKLQVAFNHRWLSSYYSGRAAIEAGRIGRPLTAYARKNDTIFVPTEYIPWAARTTPAWFLSCHDIDLVRWFFGAEPVEARAWGVKQVLAARGIDTWDSIQAQVRFAGGAIATFESAWIYPNTFPAIVESFVEVIGERGHLHFDRKCESVEMSTEQAFTYPKNFLAAEVFGTLRGAYPACLDDFIKAILEDREPSAGVVDGRQVTAVLAAIHRSLETGATEAVPPLP